MADGVPPDRRPAPHRLGSWKEIASYLGRSTRTVQRWERQEGLPVKRLPHDKLASVYALREEIDEWWQSRGARLADQEPAVPADPPARDTGPDRRSVSGLGRRWGPLALLLVVTGSLAGLWAGGLLRWPDTRRPSPPAPDATSIAVLPFLNLGPDPAEDYLSDGLSEEIIGALASIPRLRVIARTSSFQFKGKNVDLRQVGRDLGVAHVLEGSVRRAGGRIRVTAQLIDTSTGMHEWSRVHDREYGDLLRVEHEIASGVAAALRVVILEGASRRPAARDATDAYTLVLQARRALNAESEAGTAEAIALLDRAVASEPGYAEAWAELAMAYRSRIVREPGPAAESVAAARKAAENAVSLDADNGRAHQVLGFVHKVYDHDWAAAGAEFERARALMPGSAEVLASASGMAKTHGRLEEAIELIRQAIARDPLRAEWRTVLAWNLLLAGRPQEAEPAVRRAAALSPDAPANQYILCRVLLAQGRADEALRLEFSERDRPFRLICQALAQEARGRRAEALAAAAALESLRPASMAFHVAVMHAALGHKESAFSWLEVARAQHDGSIPELRVEPLLRPLHGEPRFRSLVRELELD